MTFGLAVFDTHMSVGTTYTHATTPLFMIGSPEIIVKPPGIGYEMKLRVRPDRISIPPRSIVRYMENDTVLFRGVVIVTPNPASPGGGPADSDHDALELVTAVDMRVLVEESVCREKLVIPNDLAGVAYLLATAYAHPAIIVNILNFTNVGLVVDSAAYPEWRLSDALDDLVERSGGTARWYVNLAGALVFGPA